MRRLRAVAPVIPSLLDRLIDDEPFLQEEPVRSTAEQLLAIKNNIRRDLENLLNTRLRVPVDFQRFNELQTSVVNYGLPDFSHIAIDSEVEQADFANRIAALIDRYEPRFRNVRVDIQPIGEGLHRAMYVRISALLLIEPDPVPVLFDSRIKHIDKRLQLRELKHG